MSYESNPESRFPKNFSPLVKETREAAYSVVRKTIDDSIMMIVHKDLVERAISEAWMVIRRPIHRQILNEVFRPRK